LAALVALLVLSPAITHLVEDFPVLPFFFCLVVIAALRSLDLSRSHMQVSVALALLALAYDTAVRLDLITVGSPALLVLTPAAYAMFLATGIVGLLRGIMAAPTISTETIRGGISVYLLMGCLWMLLYRIVAIVTPDAFNVPWIPNQTERELLYFSFTTITTLGYGDIVPKSGTARMLANLEAIVGQVFLAVFIARLVGMQVAHQTKDR
jgi:hypothetical protein